MRKKWLYLIEVLGFVLLFCLLFGKIESITSHKLRLDHPVRNFFSQKENSQDVLILGSSHAYYSFYPMEMWDKYGIPAYNLGSPIQSMGASYHLLKQALKEQSPKVVVVETYCTYLEKPSKSDERLRSVSDSMPLGIEKMALLEEMDLTDPEYSYYFPLFKYHGRWKSLEKKDFRLEEQYCKGAAVRASVEPQPEPEDIGETQEIPAVAREYLDKIITLCREQQIELVLVETPFVQDGGKDYKRKRQILNQVERYAAKQGVPFLNFFKLADEIGLNYQTDMLEPQHLNIRGALKTTNYLASYLSEEYQLPDRRGTEGYEQWQQDSDDFQQYLISQKLPVITDPAEYLEALRGGNYTVAVLNRQLSPQDIPENALHSLQALGLMADVDKAGSDCYLGILRNGEILYETYEPGQEYQLYEGLDYISIGNNHSSFMNVNKENFKVHKHSINLLVYDRISKRVVDQRRINKNGTLH